MRYLLFDVDLARGLPSIELTPEHDGVGIVVRRQRRPIGFVLRAVAPGTTLASADVARLVDGVSIGARQENVDSSAALGRAPTLTAAICTRDRPHMLPRCLASLHALARTPAAARVQLEILVVDNAPSDERTREIVARSHETRYVRAPVRGLDFARNCALREAFPGADVAIEAYGNVLATSAFLHGLATHELTPQELDHRDPSYEMLITARVVKAR